MISNNSSKSACCMGSSFCSAFVRPSLSSDMIIWRMTMIRSASKNICSVRHSPIPSAPKWRAFCVSSGVSALARTVIRRAASAHDMMVSKSPDNCGSIVATSPSYTSPAEPSMVMISPSVRVLPPICIWPVFISIRTSPAPETQARPMPRATTAAWLVIPPRAVKMPAAACMP